LWDAVITEILHTPTWGVFGVLGVALFWLGRKRAPAEIFIN
jgi:MYXO-CTERM domain-containing protein